MACELDDFQKNIENLRIVVRKSFARIYASLKARELKTLRQLEAISKQCQDDVDLKKNCVQNIEINFDNECVLLEKISCYGVIDFEKLNFDSNTFTLEDYVSPNDDHMYLYKTIEDLTKEECNDELEAIEEAALKEVTSTEDCVCFVTIHTNEVSSKFRNLNASSIPVPVLCDSNKANVEVETESHDTLVESVKSNSLDTEILKVNPTDDWLNSIKSQTETEPTQVTDVMEHSTITCS